MPRWSSRLKKATARIWLRRTAADFGKLAIAQFACHQARLF